MEKIIMGKVLSNSLVDKILLDLYWPMQVSSFGKTLVTILQLDPTKKWQRITPQHSLPFYLRQRKVFSTSLQTLYASASQTTCSINIISVLCPWSVMNDGLNQLPSASATYLLALQRHLDFNVSAQCARRWSIISCGIETSQPNKCQRCGFNKCSESLLHTTPSTN